MKTATLPKIVRLHCAATKPALSLDGLISTAYGISGRQFRHLVASKRNPSAKFLDLLNNYHIRLFPTEPVLLEIPNHPPVLLGDTTQLSTLN